MKQLIIKDNGRFAEPDIFVNGVNIYDMKGITCIELVILPGEHPRLRIEMDISEGMDIDVPVETEDG